MMLMNATCQRFVESEWPIEDMWPGSCYVKSHMSSIISNATLQPPVAALPALQTRPRLSIVLISIGPVPFLDRALKMVLETQFCLETELVVVRACGSEDEKAHLFRLSRQHGFSLELAPAGAAREALADLGSRRASGDIMAVKDDYVSDDLWLSPFALPLENAVWESGVARVAEEVDDRPASSVAKPAPSVPPVADRVAPQPRQQITPKRRAESATELNA
jgi:hypothetical protein